MRILLAVDDSEYSTAAVNEVAKRPWPGRSMVKILNVVEPVPIGVEPWVGEIESLDQIEAELKTRASRLIKKITERLKKKDLRVQSVIRNGSAASEIVGEAEEWPADLIVVGSHGYNAIKRLFLGSVALSVITHAPCSVEVVRSKKKKS
jgi:nucleotide-binding universal stress UspA family protein